MANETTSKWSDLPPDDDDGSVAIRRQQRYTIDDLADPRNKKLSIEAVYRLIPVDHSQSIYSCPMPIPLLATGTGIVVVVDTITELCVTKVYHWKIIATYYVITWALIPIVYLLASLTFHWTQPQHHFRCDLSLLPPIKANLGS